MARAPNPGAFHERITRLAIRSRPKNTNSNLIIKRLPARPGGKRKEDSLYVASWLEKPLKVKPGAKSVRRQPHEAAMTSLGREPVRRAPGGEGVSQAMRRSRKCLTAAATGKDGAVCPSTARC